MPLHSNGLTKNRSFIYGSISGAVEPLGAILTILLASIATPILPYMLTFAAGAMLYVVVEELIPEMAEGEHSHIGTISFAAGFSLMIVLDTALG
jgi:ZIP family zinc transporter